MCSAMNRRKYKLFRNEEDWKEVRSALSDHAPPSINQTEKQRFARHRQIFELDGTLIRVSATKQQVIESPEGQVRLAMAIHDAMAHGKRDVMMHSLRELYFWKGMKQTCATVVCVHA